MSQESPPRHDPYIALKQPNYRRYFIGNAFSLMGMQMTTFTVAYELYERTSSPFLMGVTGLVQVIPIIAMALPVGHLLDRINRKTAILWATGIQIFVFALLGLSSVLSPHVALPPALKSLGDWHVPIAFFLLLVHGCCRAVNQPAKQSLVPALVKPEHFANAVSFNSQLFEATNVVGPMIAGYAVAQFLVLPSISTNSTHTYAYAIIYWANALCQVINWWNMWRIQLTHTPRAKEPMTLQSMLAGARFVHKNKVILSSITLDMFAVLLGGATMMLPVFAKEVIYSVNWPSFINNAQGHIGPMGLSFLRASASIGAILMAFIVNHRGPMRNAGRNLLVSVAGFGIAMIVFGISRNFWLSMIALFFTGLFDSVSVIVRHSLVQLNTPDDMRGRVSAINSVFISASNELGEFRSGVTTWMFVALFMASGQPEKQADAWGAMTSVIVGGVGTCIVVLVAAKVWPQLRAVKTLDGHH